MKSASPMNLNLGSATSHGTGSPDSLKLASIMNGPLSADASPLSLDQLVYDLGTDRLGAGMYSNGYIIIRDGCHAKCHFL